MFSVFLLLGGTAVAILFSNYEPKTYNVLQLEDRFLAPESLTFIGVYYTLGFVCLFYS